MMDRKRAAELLPIIQAFSEGKDIQWREPDNEWHDCMNNHSFCAIQYFQYRIKPEPFEIWVAVDDNWNVHDIYKNAHGIIPKRDYRLIHLLEV